MDKRIHTKYIFCVNPGRSGSHYLSKLFAHVENCQAFHEPDPIGNGEVIQQFLKGDDLSARQVAEQKADFIKKNAPADTVYVETNHCFIKGFGWFLPDILSADKIGIIILTRNKAQVVNSTYRIGCRPLHESGRRWLLTPDLGRTLKDPPTKFGLSASLTYKLFKMLNYPFSGIEPFVTISKLISQSNRGNVESNLNPSPNGLNASDKDVLKVKKNQKRKYYPNRIITDYIKAYELSCLNWYYDEIYALGDEYLKRFPEMRYVNISIDQLNKFEEIKRLLSFFDLKEKESIHTIFNKPTNRDTRTRK